MEDLLKNEISETENKVKKLNKEDISKLTIKYETLVFIKMLYLLISWINRRRKLHYLNKVI
jgi:hypothetical protein